jgi:hypothetical protein
LSVAIRGLEDDVAVAAAVTAAYIGTGTGQSMDDLFGRKKEKRKD